MGPFVHLCVLNRMYIRDASGEPQMSPLTFESPSNEAAQAE